MAVQGQQLLTGGGIPDGHRAVLRGCGQPGAIRAVDTDFPGHGQDHLPAGRVPNEHGARGAILPRGCGQPAAIRAVVDALYHGCHVFCREPNARGNDRLAQGLLRLGRASQRDGLQGQEYASFWIKLQVVLGGQT